MASNVSLIGTRHDDLGSYNKYDFAAILRNFNPDVIFIEDSDEEHFFENGTIESRAIYHFLAMIPLESKPKIVPVDIDIVKDEFFDRMRDYFMNPVYFNSIEFQLLQRSINQKIQENGLKYMNSIEGEDDEELLNELQKQIVAKINNDKITSNCEEWYQVEKKRNDAFLDNIYNYWEHNEVKNGVFIVGYGHRKKLKDLIEKRKSDLINWNYCQ